MGLYESYDAVHEKILKVNSSSSFENADAERLEIHYKK